MHVFQQIPIVDCFQLFVTARRYFNIYMVSQFLEIIVPFSNQHCFCMPSIENSITEIKSPKTRYVYNIKLDKRDTCTFVKSSLQSDELIYFQISLYPFATPFSFCFFPPQFLDNCLSTFCHYRVDYIFKNIVLVE